MQQDGHAVPNLLAQLVEAAREEGHEGVVLDGEAALARTTNASA